jgi:hypothetical protein
MIGPVKITLTRAPSIDPATVAAGFFLSAIIHQLGVPAPWIWLTNSTQWRRHPCTAATLPYPHNPGSSLHKRPLTHDDETSGQQLVLDRHDSGIF